jgi:hypothetical protein
MELLVEGRELLHHFLHRFFWQQVRYAEVMRPCLLSKP